MKVSIVTISFNQGPYMEQALCSVLEQDYPNIEYIVVDAGSTDGSREIIERYKNRIAKVIFEPDNGAADGLNKGFRFASGEVFAFLNSDDYLLPGAVSRMVRAFNRYPSADIISGHAHVIDGEGNILYNEFSKPFSLRSYLSGCGMLIQQSTYFRAEAYRRTQGFNTSNITCWDGELMVDMAVTGARFRLLNQFIACFRIHPQSVSGSGRLEAEYHQTIARIVAGLGQSTPQKISRLYCLFNQMKNPYGLIARLIDQALHHQGRARRKSIHEGR